MNIVAMLAKRTVARFIPGAKATVRCSACQRERNGSVQLIAGPGVYLCNSCIQRASRQLAPRRPAPDAIRCRFCRQLRPPPEVTHVEGLAVCADCLGLMEHILETADTSRTVS
ncbi:MAG TPA: ClpX C4-type zinc finger protein [Gemmatimonadaceae bacterium]|nr:ClpX C4-type zinc finger protein [Gemmatimonadaceae bacterium]